MGAPLVHDTGGGEFEKIEPGTYPGVCTWIVGLGPQPTPWGVKEKVKFRFEIPSERISWIDADGHEQEGPAITWATYTASLAEKAELRQVLESWRGRRFSADELKGFDLNKVLGAPCMIVIVHKEGKNGKVYDHVDRVSRLTKGLPKPEPEGELVGFDPRNHTPEEFAKLPEWLRNIVQMGISEIKALEELAQSEPSRDDTFADDDIPF